MLIFSLSSPHARRSGSKVLLFLALCACLGARLASGEGTDEALLASRQEEAKSAFTKDVAPFLKEYCLQCHSNRRTRGDLNFEPALKTPGESSAMQKWKKAFANVSAHDMPPEDEDQPSDAERQRFLDALGRLKYLSTRDPGPFVIRRLTKVEYGNTLRDLLGVEAGIARDLPDEVAGEGYLNSLSPMQTEQYLGIANEALRQMTAEVEKRLLGPEGSDIRDIARRLARLAYRRPPSEPEVEVLVRIHALGQENGLDRNGALRFMLKAVLVSPQFLFITPASEVSAGEKIAPLDDHQIASRLSYLLWSTMPDAKLGRLADEGRLREPAVLKAQAERLLLHPRSRALFDGFGAQWLGLDALATKTFDTEKFPQMTPALRAAMYDEARLLFESIVRENRSVVTFVSANYTHLNDTLAAVYGLPGKAAGSSMERVTLTDANRGGILTLPGILAATSFATRTSAVKRGVWVLEEVLGQHVPPAPPNVPVLEQQDPKKAANLTLRQRTELHRTEAVCANCHKILDPIGFGLENFDAIGRWRDKDESGAAIDAAGELPGGKRFATPAELKGILAARREDLVRNLTEKLLAYALCRQLDGYDHIIVDQMLLTLKADGDRMQTLIREIVTSYPFLYRRVQE